VRGCAQLTYVRYLIFDAVGTGLYTTLWVVVGAFIGERAVIFFTTDRRRWLFLGLAALVAGTLLGYRLWRQYRYGAARPSSVTAEVPRCDPSPGLAGEVAEGEAG
jgi:membrane protein DedA with SNARE-associated domain